MCKDGQTRVSTFKEHGPGSGTKKVTVYMFSDAFAQALPSTWNIFPDSEYCKVKVTEVTQTHGMQLKQCLEGSL